MGAFEKKRISKNKIESAERPPLPDSFSFKFSQQKEKSEEDTDVSSKIKRDDPLTVSLGCEGEGYYYKMTWPWFKEFIGGVGYRLCVDRYYPTKKIAIDFIRTEVTKDHLVLKQNLLKKNGIEYFKLTDFKSIEMMLEKVAQQ